MSQFVSSKNVFIQLDKENLSPLGELACNASLNELAQLISNSINKLSEQLDTISTTNDELRLSIADLQSKYNLLKIQLDTLDVGDAYIDLDLGALTNPCPTGRLSLLTILQIFKNEISILKSK